MAQNNTSLKLELVRQMSTLATAGFGFVAALAWNEAIQGLFQRIFPDRSGLVAKFVYAIIVTMVVVIITTRLSRLVETLKRNSQS